MLFVGRGGVIVRQLTVLKHRAELRLLPLVGLWRLLIAYHYSMTLGALGVEVVVLNVSLIR